MNTDFQKSIQFVIFALILTLLIPITYGEAESSQTEPTPLKVLMLPFLHFAPFFIAVEEGYFREQGLHIEFVEGARSVQAIPSLAMGQIDVFGGVFSPALLNAIARSNTIKIVADRTRLVSSPCISYSLLIRQSLIESGDLTTIAQLAGKRIALEAMNTAGYYLEKVLQTEGLTLDDIQVVDIPYPLIPEILEKGEIDATVVGEPWRTRILQGGYAEGWMPAQQIIQDYQFAFIVFGPSLLEGTPNVGRRFMVAYLKAVRQYNQGKTDRNVEIISAHTRLDKEFLQQVCWPSIRDDGQIHITSVFDYQKWAMEKGYIDTLVSEEQFWDPQFVEYANQILNTSP